jgi:hypothetical protein
LNAYNINQKYTQYENTKSGLNTGIYIYY